MLIHFNAKRVIFDGRQHEFCCGAPGKKRFFAERAIIEGIATYQDGSKVRRRIIVTRERGEQEEMTINRRRRM